MVIRESVAAAVRGTRDKRFERIRLNGYENYHWKSNLLPTRPRNLPRGWICWLMVLARYTSPDWEISVFESRCRIKRAACSIVV